MATFTHNSFARLAFGTVAGLTAMVALPMAVSAGFGAVAHLGAGLETSGVGIALGVGYVIGAAAGAVALVKAKTFEYMIG
jgi:hypothetical protein